MKTLNIIAGLIIMINQAAFAQRLQPSDMEYKGAFRLPQGGNGNDTWAYGGNALAFYPGGNPQGANDGYPGSLYGTGHLYALHVSEISIPVPKITDNINDLNTAATLQPFASITGNVTPAGTECVVAGLEYLPAQGSQTSGKLYFVQGHHWMEFDNALGNTNQPTAWWADLTLSNPHPSRPWRLGTTNSYNTCGYVFEIPSAWATTNTSGKKLAIGNHREARSGSMGPALYACSPWESGNPPAANSSIPAKEIMKYGEFSSTGDTSKYFPNYRHSDKWGGGAWLESSGKSAVVLVGSKGLGWEKYEPNCAGKGWYCQYFDGEIIFFDPADYAKVTAGTMQPYQLKPYATLSIQNILYSRNNGCRANVDGVAYDRANNLLYVTEVNGDGAYPVVHVWKIKSNATAYTLTVTGGSGSGSYASGTTVTVTAATAPAGKVFDQWTGSITGLANKFSAATTLTMPSANTAITATYKTAPVNTFSLTVSGGTGSGSYAAGANVTVTANAAPAGKVFDQWTGSIPGLANKFSASTTLTMPSANTAITATYKTAPVNTFSLTVTGGTGSGSYAAGTSVTIKAGTAPAGKIFDQWTGATSALADKMSASTTLTMPSANSTITATYKTAPVNTYSLTVVNGTGSGSYAAGTKVNIRATIPSGKSFDRWNGSTNGIGSISAYSTTYTMPAANATLSASFKNATTAVEEDKEAISIYPNPAADILNINAEKIVRISIYDLNGRMMIDENNVSSSIDISHLESGVYVIIIYTGDEVYRKSFIKQ